MARQLLKGLWTFPIVLPDSPLKWLNCYVLNAENGGRNLLVDTGFPFEACKKSLLKGIEELKLDMGNTDVFLTHLHSDHVGNAALLQSMGARVFISSTDLRCWQDGVHGRWDATFRRTAEEGFPEEFTKKMIAKSSDCLFLDAPEGIRTVEEGDVLPYGDYSFQCVATPGHTPGHMCLYDARKKLMLCGDHVLFDITPNIVSWAGVENSLGDYIASLRKLRNYDIKYAFPGHRKQSDKDIYTRAAEIIAHHGRRLRQVTEIIAEKPGIGGYEIASRLTWNINSPDWDSFPLMQKYFAMRETVAHLDYLCLENRIRWELKDGRRHYFVCSGL